MGYLTLAFFGVIMTSVYNTALSATTAVPESTDEPEAMSIGDEILEFIRENPEYMAMIGMGIVIVLLFITAVCAICLLSGRNRSDDYKK